MRVAARLLLAVALLLAQQVALAHQVWHLGKNPSQPGQAQLCEQHDALATVAGALDSPIIEMPVVATRDAPGELAFSPGAGAPRVSPACRSPPPSFC